MDDNINGVGSAAEMPETDAAAIDEPIVDEGSGTEDGEPKKPLKLDYAQTFKVGFAFAIIMIFWTAYDFVVPLLLEHAYGLSNTVRGLIMGLDNLLSLFMLPLFGKLSDNAKGKLVKKWGRRTPFIVIGTIAAVILMVFVPVSTLGQQEKAMDIENGYLAQLDEDAFMEERLTDFWEKGGNYADRDYMAMNNIDKEQFLAIRYDGKFTATKAFLGMLGATTYKYDGVEVSLDAAVPADLAYTLYDWNGDGTLTYDDIRISNENYEKFAATGMNTWISDQIYDQATNTTQEYSHLYGHPAPRPHCDGYLPFPRSRAHARRHSQAPALAGQRGHQPLRRRGRRDSLPHLHRRPLRRTAGKLRHHLRVRRCGHAAAARGLPRICA